jgi:hypothetical protein
MGKQRFPTNWLPRLVPRPRSAYDTLPSTHLDCALGVINASGSDSDSDSVHSDLGPSDL